MGFIAYVEEVMVLVVGVIAHVTGFIGLLAGFIVLVVKVTVLVVGSRRSRDLRYLYRKRISAQNIALKSCAF